MRYIPVFVALSFSFNVHAQKNLKKVNPNPLDPANIPVNHEEYDFSKCLKAMNEKSKVWKDKIFPLDAKAQTFLIKHGGKMIVMGPKLYYVLGDPTCTTKINVDRVDIIQRLYNTVAFEDATNKQAVANECSTVPITLNPAKPQDTSQKQFLSL